MIEIQANEIRVGNWVTCVGIYKDSILRAGMVQVDAEFILLVENKKILAVPVSLNPEILEKCGFEFKDMMFANKPMRYWRNDWFCLNLFDKGESYILYLWNEKESEKDIYISSLHQLQNIYYYITGKELEINLTAKTVPQ